MKKIILAFSLMMATLVSNAQFSKTKSTTDSNSVIIKSVVELKNGHEEKVLVNVTGSMSAVVWGNFVQGRKISDSAAFDFVVKMLSIQAQYSLKNSDSYEPMKNQFIMWYEKDQTFMSNFKMMGRNGYGNMTETSAMVEYDPSK